jgi:hypothetical protein
MIDDIVFENKVDLTTWGFDIMDTDVLRLSFVKRVLEDISEVVDTELRTNTLVEIHSVDKPFAPAIKIHLPITARPDYTSFTIVLPMESAIDDLIEMEAADDTNIRRWAAAFRRYTDRIETALGKPGGWRPTDPWPKEETT